MIFFLQHLEASHLHNVKSVLELVLEIRKRPLQKMNLLSIAMKLKLSESQKAVLAGVGLIAFKNLKSSDALSIHASELVVKLAQLYEPGTGDI